MKLDTESGKDAKLIRVAFQNEMTSFFLWAIRQAVDVNTDLLGVCRIVRRMGPILDGLRETYPDYAKGLRADTLDFTDHFGIITKEKEDA